MTLGWHANGISWKHCLSETYLDSTVLLDDDNMVISGYNIDSL